MVALAPQTETAAPAPTRVSARPAGARRAPLPASMPLPAALLVAVAAGPVFDGAFPDRDWWPLAIPVLALLLWALRGRGFGSGLLVGLLFGESFYLVHILWATTFLGPVPWAALSTVMGVYTGLGAGLIALAWRWIPTLWPGTLGRLLLTPATIAGLWTAREAVSSTFPYGGFSWGRVAFSQSDGAFTGLFPWLGASGTSFALVFAAALIVAVGVELWGRRAARPGGMVSPPAAARAVEPWALVAAPLVLLATLAALPGWPVPTDGTIRVGAVQGNTKAGYFDPPAHTGDNLLGQARATLPIVDDDLDVVIWPEGGSDLDPLRSADAAAVFDRISELADAPLLSGIITKRPGPDGTDLYFNTSTLWEAGRGQVAFYDKRHPVPFGEYVPDRAFFRPFAPELIDLIQREYTPGTTAPTLPVAGTRAGIAICFDIVDDGLMREEIRDGAQVIFAQTNNADFGRTDENVQQLAIARIRALEFGRSVVNISTVGTSGLIAPDGSVSHEIAPYTVGTIVADVPLSSTVTPAALLGGGLEAALGLGALALLLGAGITVRARRGR
ncbi:MAG: apolipoprotein N-acyltransferase [Actinomycetales bacterium]|nr:apolipoprotein N-acyltransferase [Actinomycetales bacterium]